VISSKWQKKRKKKKKRKKNNIPLQNEKLYKSPPHRFLGLKAVIDSGAASLLPFFSLRKETRSYNAH